MSNVDGFFKRYDENNRFTDVMRFEQFQESCIKKLLHKAGVPNNLRLWKQEQFEARGHRKLTMDWFEERWPGFPMQLLIAQYQYPGKLTYASLLGGRLSKLRVFQDYLTLVEDHNISVKTDRCGMLFKCQRARTATLQVLHNQPTQSNVVDFDGTPEKAEGTHCRRFMFWYRGINYVIEGIDSFMSTVGKEWATDD
jgi:hypothetical protein